MKKILCEVSFAITLALGFLAALWILNMPIAPSAFFAAVAVFMVALFFQFAPRPGYLFANTFGTLNTTLIAQKTLTTLLAKFPILARISTDFGDNPLLFNQSLKVKLASARTAISYSTTNGYVPADATLVDSTVTLNQHIHDTYQVNDQEASSTSLDLIARFANISAYALGRKIMDDLMALVLNANFSSNTVVGAPGVFDRDKLIDVNKAMNDRNVPDLERMALLNNDYYAALKKDLVVVSNAVNPASNVVESGVLPDVDGNMVARYTSLPGNSENLVGAVFLPEALALATRVPMAPPEGLPVGGLVTVVRDDNSGLAIQVREWYEFALGQHRRTSTLMYGVAIGNAPMLQRLVSA